MAAHIAMQQADQRQGWSSLPSWGAPPSSCGGGNTWSKRLSAMANDDDNDSWEVRAFAEDASSSGQWPPRSYACSFCRRGFRTAQALGGHMNVHRRERQEANKLAQLRNAAAAAAAAATATAAASAPPACAPAALTNHWDLTSLSHLLDRTPSRTAELLSPESLSLSLTGSTICSSVPSPESISSSQRLGVPADILCESINQLQGRTSWSQERAFHPYERPGRVNLGRFSIMQSDESPVVDLELRLGQSC